MWSIVRKMLSSPEPVENAACAEEVIAALPANFREFLNSEGFRFNKAYTFHASRLGVWIRISPDAPLRTFYLNKHATGIVCEFTTAFSDDMSLTTTVTRSAFLFPLRYGTFMQSFPNAKPEELWRTHLRGEDYLTSQLGVRVEECRLPFLEGFRRGVIAKLTYVTSHRLWFVRGIYWYLLKRFMLQNRPLWEQDVSKLYGRAA